MKIFLTLIFSIIFASGCSSMAKVHKKQQEKSKVYSYIQDHFDEVMGFYNKVGSVIEFEENDDYSWLVHTDIPYNSWQSGEKNTYIPALTIELGAVHQILEVAELIPAFIKRNSALTKQYVENIHRILIQTGEAQITQDIKVDYMKNSSGWDSINPLVWDDIYSLTVKDAFKLTKVASCEHSSNEINIWTPYCYKGVAGTYNVEFRGKSGGSYKHALVYVDFDKNSLMVMKARSATDLKANKSIIEIPLNDRIK